MCWCLKHILNNYNLFCFFPVFYPIERSYRLTTKESWIGATFNAVERDQAGVSRSAAAPADEDVFLASDEEPVFFCSDDELAVESDSDQPLAASDSEVFFSSEPEDARSTAPCRPRKRARYNARSSERLKFLGRPVCRFALSRLLQVGDSSLQKLRTGQPLLPTKIVFPYRSTRLSGSL